MDEAIEIDKLSGLEAMSLFGDMYFSDPEKFDGDKKKILYAVNDTINRKLPKEARGRSCKYIAALVNDICQRNGHNVQIVKGLYIFQNGRTWEHHWNEDLETGLQMDAMPAKPVMCAADCKLKKSITG